MRTTDPIGLDQFLAAYPQMAVRPSPGTHLRLKGTFAFCAEHGDHGRICDAFELLVEVPPSFPQDLPVVKEVAGRIPMRGEFHINGDRSLCLGSRLRLLLKLRAAPTLSGFAARCLVPYLYAISKKLRDGGKLVFGELAHYGSGMLADYAQLLGLKVPDQVRGALALLGTKRRVANKLRCPCGCSLRLGRCKFNRRLAQFRRLASRTWFKRELALAHT
ncbi:MAG TPA: hypothetical protein VEA69_14870 [Tepidisphaeraceae bacterium]|nr:hypothetical protein [Tepidisphaeraceae bacterium]